MNCGGEKLVRYYPKLMEAITMNEEQDRDAFTHACKAIEKILEEYYPGKNRNIEVLTKIIPIIGEYGRQEMKYLQQEIVLLIEKASN
jgi:hypothetical protein